MVYEMKEFPALRVPPPPTPSFLLLFFPRHPPVTESWIRSTSYPLRCVSKFSCQHVLDLRYHASSKHPRPCCNRTSQHKKRIIREAIAADFDEQMIQDAMAIILLPTSRGNGARYLPRRRSQPIRQHLQAWYDSKLPDPLKVVDDHLIGQLNRLHCQLLFFIEDYITKATSAFPPREYLCLPQIPPQPAEGHLMFRGVKVAARFNSGKLTSAERKRFLKAFILFELLFSDTFYFDANAYASDTPIFENWPQVYHENDMLEPPSNIPFGKHQCYNFEKQHIISSQRYDRPARITVPSAESGKATDFSTLGLDRFSEFLHSDMADPDEREALEEQLQDISVYEQPCYSIRPDKKFFVLLHSDEHFKNGLESSMYKKLSSDYRLTARGGYQDKLHRKIG